MQRNRVFSYGFNHPERRPPQPPPEPEVKGKPDLDQDEPLDDADQAEGEIDPFAEADALAAMDPADFCRLLRAQVEKVQRGELLGGVEDAHPLPNQRPRSKRYKRRDKHGRAF